MEKNDELTAFAVRMNAICDEQGIPPKGKARQITLAKIFGVSQKGARKWLEGESFPALAKCIQIAKWANVSFDWLMTGRNNKRTEEDSSNLHEKSQAINEKTRPTTRREQTILDLIASLPKSEQEELMRALEKKKQHYDNLLEELLIARKGAA